MPREDATVMDEISSTSGDLKDKLVNLTKSLADAENRKKAAMKAYGDEIKDLKEDIKMTLDLLKEEGGE